ncbi:MAG: 16S rRNA (cytosine(967)-C(5))-methyltransferase RsmB [Ruminiclostridium sp.]
MVTARQTAYDLLLKTELQGAYSNIALDEALEKSGLAGKDRAFAAALFYGVLERKMTLDYLIRAYSKTEYDKLDKRAVQLLRMGLYQLLYMTAVPESAAVNETVKLCPQRLKGFANAVLRAFIRGGSKLSFDGLDENGRLSVEYSCPKWLVKMWRKSYGDECTLAMLKSSFGRPPLYAKVNTLKCTADSLIERLSSENIPAVRNPLLSDCIEIGKISGIERCKAYREGLFHVQDISSQLCCKIVAPQSGETVLDMCAAPGGKSFSMAEAMENKGRLLSFDLYEARTELIKSGASRLGLDVITAGVNDALLLNEAIPIADRVLCDVVCSGLGVIRRKPEIKYKPKAEIAEIPEIQRKILDTSKNYVKAGGLLVYSTCTLNPEENEIVAKDFLAKNSDFTPELISADIAGGEGGWYRSFFPHITGGDGFFAASFRRKG